VRNCGGICRENADSGSEFVVLSKADQIDVSFQSDLVGRLQHGTARSGDRHSVYRADISLAPDIHLPVLHSDGRHGDRISPAQLRFEGDTVDCAVDRRIYSSP
jgi:hypothetical protein